MNRQVRRSRPWIQSVVAGLSVECRVSLAQLQWPGGNTKPFHTPAQKEWRHGLRHGLCCLVGAQGCSHCIAPVLTLCLLSNKHLKLGLRSWEIVWQYWKDWMPAILKSKESGCFCSLRNCGFVGFVCWLFLSFFFFFVEIPESKAVDTFPVFMYRLWSQSLIFTLKRQKVCQQVRGRKSRINYLLTMHCYLTSYYVPGVNSLRNSIDSLLTAVWLT